MDLNTAITIVTLIRQYGAPALKKIIDVLEQENADDITPEKLDEIRALIAKDPEEYFTEE
jgi:hypothetical protein